MKIVTFVIPAYNSAGYLDTCIPSMLSTEVLDRLEIIVVDDGSTDGTAQAAEKYRSQYPDVIRVISQENKGHGGALNTGCAEARGKYLKVVDADDWVVTENLPAYVTFLEKCGSDVVLTHHHMIDIGSGTVTERKNFPAEFGRGYTFAEILPQWRNFCRSLTFHGITYRTEFYRENNNQLPEHVFYEDYEFAAFPCCRAKSVTAVDLFLYEYRVGDVNQSVSAANQLKRTGHTEAVLRNMTEKYNTLPETPGKRYAARKIQELLLSYFTTVLLVEPDRKKGRKMAAEQLAWIQTAAPEVYGLAKRKYQVFLLMNRLHISKQMWDGFLNSQIYHFLRKMFR